MHQVNTYIYAYVYTCNDDDILCIYMSMVCTVCGQGRVPIVQALKVAGLGSHTLHVWPMARSSGRADGQNSVPLANHGCSLVFGGGVIPGFSGCAKCRPSTTIIDLPIQYIAPWHVDE